MHEKWGGGDEGVDKMGEMERSGVESVDEWSNGCGSGACYFLRPGASLQKKYPPPLSFLSL